MANLIYVKVYNVDSIDNKLFSSAYQGVPVAGARAVYGTLQNVPAVRSKILLNPLSYPNGTNELYVSETVQQIVTLMNA